MRFHWQKYQLRLKNPFVLSYGTFDFRHAYIVSLTENGHQGLGEGTAISYYGWLEEQIEENLHWLQTEMDKATDLEVLADDARLLPPVRNACISARMDLRAKQQNQSLRQYYGVQPAKLPISSITLSGQSREEMEAQLSTYRDWPTMKIKLGNQYDPVLLDFIQSHPEKNFYIDANSGWNANWMIENSEKLNSPHIRLIEQPLPISQIGDLKEVKKMIHTPIFADESCQQPADLKKLTGLFDGVNIKLMKCGGPDKALVMIREARKLGLKIMLGCMTESSVGISHAAQMLPLVDFADLDGNQLIQCDPGSGIDMSGGVITLSEKAGIGVHLVS